MLQKLNTKYFINKIFKLFLSNTDFSIIVYIKILNILF